MNLALKDLSGLCKFDTIHRMETFGERLREWRESKGLSLYRINKLTNIPVPNLVSIEKGRRPASEEVLRKLSEIPEMGIDFDTLKAWKILGEFPIEDITRAYEIVRKEREGE